MNTLAAVAPSNVQSNSMQNIASSGDLQNNQPDGALTFDDHLQNAQTSQQPPSVPPSNESNDSSAASGDQTKTDTATSDQKKSLSTNESDLSASDSTKLNVPKFNLTKLNEKNGLNDGKSGTTKSDDKKNSNALVQVANSSAVDPSALVMNWQQLQQVLTSQVAMNQPIDLTKLGEGNSAKSTSLTGLQGVKTAAAAGFSLLLKGISDTDGGDESDANVLGSVGTSYASLGGMRGVVGIQGVKSESWDVDDSLPDKSSEKHLGALTDSTFSANQVLINGNTGASQKAVETTKLAVSELKDVSRVVQQELNTTPLDLPKRLEMTLETPKGAVVNLYLQDVKGEVRAQFSTNDPKALEWLQREVPALKEAPMETNVKWLPPQMGEHSSTKQHTQQDAQDQQNSHTRQQETISQDENVFEDTVQNVINGTFANYS